MSVWLAKTISTQSDPAIPFKDKILFWFAIAYCNTLSNLGSGSAPKSYRKLPLLSPPPPPHTHLWALPVDFGYTHPRPPPPPPPPPHISLSVNKPSYKKPLMKMYKLRVCKRQFTVLFWGRSWTLSLDSLYKQTTQPPKTTFIIRNNLSEETLYFVLVRKDLLNFGRLEQKAVFNPRLTTALIPKPL